MSRTKELLKNTGILVVAKISTQVVSFLLLPLYTALLSTAEYGEIDVYTSLNMIVIPFLTLQSEMGIFRYFITAKTDDDRQSIVSSGISIICINVMIVSVIYYIVSCFFPIHYRYYLMLYYLSLTLSTVLLQIVRAEGKTKIYGIASFIASALAVCLNALFIAGFHWKVEGILIASIVAHLVSALYLIKKTEILEYYRWKAVTKESYLTLLKYSTPLVFNQISSWVINYSDRLIIINFLGIGLNGIYAIANKFSNITSMFFGMFNLAWTESVVRSLDDEDAIEYISKLFMLIFNIYLVLITGIINILPFLYDLLINSAYEQAYYHVPILLVAMFFSGMAATLGSIFIACNKTKSVSVTTTISAICNFIVHMILLRCAGLYAASISSLVAFALLFLYRYIIVQKIFSIKFKVKKMIIPFLIMIFSWVGYISKNPFLILSGLLMNMIDIGIIIYQNKIMGKCLPNR